MNLIVILFGAATVVAGIIIVVNPDSVFGLLRSKMDAIALQILAVGVRIIIGVALILSAAESKYPAAIMIIGWVSIVAAVALGIMGRTNFRRLISWALGLKPSIGRIGGIIAIIFGGFLVHAVI